MARSTSLSVEHGYAVDAEGNRFPAKTVLPVARGTADISGLGRQMSALQRSKLQELQPFVEAVRKFAQKEISLGNFTKQLRAQPGFQAEVARLHLAKDGIGPMFASFVTGVFTMRRAGPTRWIKSKTGRVRLRTKTTPGIQT